MSKIYRGNPYSNELEQPALELDSRGVHDSYPSSCRATVTLAYAGSKLTLLCLGLCCIKSHGP
jgi:hypothetical protein